MINKPVFALTVLTLSAMMFLYSVPAFSEVLSPDLKRGSQSLVDINLHFLQKKEVGEWGRDPFNLPREPKKAKKEKDKGQESDFSLNAIIYKNGGGAAIINNQITRKGDLIGGMSVHDIQPDRVILKDGSEVLELRVDPFTMR